MLGDGRRPGRGLARRLLLEGRAAAGSPRSTAGWTMRRAPSPVSTTSATGTITVSAPRTRTSPLTKRGATSSLSARSSCSAPPAARWWNGKPSVAGSPSASWTSATTDWVATWNPAAPTFASGRHGQPAPAVRGPSGGGTAARTPRASAMPSTSVGARSSASHSKRCAREPRGPAPELEPPARAALAAGRDQLPRRRRPRSRSPRCSVAAARSANGRGGASSGSPSRAAEREHAMRDGVVDERVDVDARPSTPHPRAEPDEPPAADLGLGRRARAAGEQRGHALPARSASTRSTASPTSCATRSGSNAASARACALAQVGELGAQVRHPRRAPRLAATPLRATEARRRTASPPAEPGLGEQREAVLDRAQSGVPGGGRGERRCGRGGRGGRPGPRPRPRARARKAWTAGTTCSHGGWSAQSQRA